MSDSLGGRRAARRAACTWWLRAGCRLVLVADPDQKMVTAYRSPADIRVFSGSEIVDCDDVIAGWREHAAAFFE